jgi:microcystin degradation protein MlrC
MDASLGGKHVLIEAVDAQEAVKRAMAADTQVFITDSGDNTTAGAAGDNAYMLNALLRAGVKDTLLAGIMDKDAVAKCYAANIGDMLTLTVGGSLSDASEKATITGRLVRRGDILGYTGGNAGAAATLDCGGVTVVVTENRAAFTRAAIFESAGLDISKYRIIVIKLGYLFPELAKIAPRAILALTPGSSTENLTDMGHKNIHRPMYPLDDNFM